MKEKTKETMDIWAFQYLADTQEELFLELRREYSEYKASCEELGSEPTYYYKWVLGQIEFTRINKNN